MNKRPFHDRLPFSASAALCTLAAALLLALPSAQAQTPASGAAWPSKPIKIVVPFPAGGTSDVLARLFGQKMSETWGQPVVVDNKPGSSGNLGADLVAKAAPDGYTLMMAANALAANPSLQKMQFDPLRDFTYIACLTGYTFGIVVKADSPIKSIKDLVSYAKANPGKFSYGSTGTGTTPHLAIEEFASKAGVQLTHVPFKGSSDGLQALLGGHIMAHSDATGWAPHVESGALRLLATYGSKRTKRWPQVPTLNELGYDTVSDSPFGIGGPRGMDPKVVRKLQDAFKKTLSDPAVLAAFDKYDQPVIYMDSEAYTNFILASYVKEKRTIERLGLGMKS